MKKTIETAWVGSKTFETTIGDHKIILDTTIENGGQGKGPSPLPLLMSSYAGCMGIDIIAILTKKGIIVNDFKIITEGVINDEDPHYYKEINAIFQLKGKDIPISVVESAVENSAEKYCGISATLKKAVNINTKVELINI